MKTLAITSTLLFMLCAPALADAPRPTTKPIRIAFQVKTAQISRAHDVSTIVQECARVHDKDASHEDEIRVCATSEDADGVHMQLDWSTREGAAEYKNISAIVVPRNASYELGSQNGIRLALQVR